MKSLAVYHGCQDLPNTRSTAQQRRTCSPLELMSLETAHIQYRPPLRSGEEATVSCQAGRLSRLSALQNRQERVQASDRENLIDLCVEVGQREPSAKPPYFLMEVD